MPQIYQGNKEPEKYSIEIIDALKNIRDKCKEEDTFIRKRHIYEAKQNDLYWHGFQYIFFDESSQEFRIPTHDVLSQIDTTREDSDFIYDYVSNIFKAHGLSIIAALGAAVPGVVFCPINSENPEDIRAAKKAEQLAKIIHKANHSKLHILNALFILFTQHILASYNYYQRDKKYGEVNIPKFKKVPTKVSPDMTLCTECEYTSELPQDVCPSCGGEVKIAPGKIKDVLSSIGSEKIQKGMSRFGLYGVINVKVPSYAVDQEACGYLLHFLDQPTAYLRHVYPHLRNKLRSVATEDYEASARAPSVSNYSADYQQNNLTPLEKCWFRPWQFECIENKSDIVDTLKSKFPSGVYCAFAGDEFAEARPEDLDDVWTITKGDLSRTIHGDPLGQIAISQQDIENTTSNLLLEALEHSVPTTFADPQILDFDTYGKMEVKSGLIYPGKRAPGMQRLEDGFASLKTATLPKEAVDLQDANANKTQFLLGSFPSIFGGPQKSGSKTLGEYTQSRSYALQRLSIPNDFIYFWWAQTTFKAVRMYIKEMLATEEEMFTVASPLSNKYETVSIFKEDFQGKFDLLIPESSGDLPVTFGQKRAFIQEAIAINSDPINMFLFAPENIQTTLQYLGFSDYKTEQEYQVMKIMTDISLLLQEAPQEQEDGQLIPTILPDPEIDDDAVQLRVLKMFLAGPGQDIKMRKPEGYMNVLARARFHKQNLAIQMMKEQLQAAPLEEGTLQNG